MVDAKTPSMVTVCIYCGSGSGTGTRYTEAARELSAEIARRGMAIVYGGARVGLMGEVADTALAHGASVTGVIPQALLEREVAHEGLSRRYVVASMHERKERMEALSDGFIALPGGLGTLEELFEVITWQHLGLHDKPCGLLNVNAYYDRLLQFLYHAVNEGFISVRRLDKLIVSRTANDLLDRMWGPDSRENRTEPATSDSNDSM
ncbi:MAG: TIGR00730 family Rossman fold protein [Spirochaetales bacterium]